MVTGLAQLFLETGPAGDRPQPLLAVDDPPGGPVMVSVEYHPHEGRSDELLAVLGVGAPLFPNLPPPRVGADMLGIPVELGSFRRREGDRASPLATRPPRPGEWPPSTREVWCLACRLPSVTGVFGPPDPASIEGSAR